MVQTKNRKEVKKGMFTYEKESNTSETKDLLKLLQEQSGVWKFLISNRDKKNFRKLIHSK